MGIYVFTSVQAVTDVKGVKYLGIIALFVTTAGSGSQELVQFRRNDMVHGGIGMVHEFRSA